MVLYIESVLLSLSLQQLISGLTYQVSSSQVLVCFLLELLSSKKMGFISCFSKKQRRPNLYLE